MPKVSKKQKTTAKKKAKKIAKPVKKTKAKKVPKTLKLLKYPYNPIIKPRPYAWESKATLNPAAFIADGKIHLIYRAIGESDVSVLGYASSLDGYKLSERPTHSIYHRYGKFVRSGLPLNYTSGGGWNGGCEDPRVTLLDNMLYMLYTAFDGWGSLRIALTSIGLEDFKQKKWNWDKPVLISPPGEIHKNWVMFPEKINGKFAILHSLSPKILIDYVDNLSEFDGTKFIKSYYHGTPAWDNGWEGTVRGVGPTPIKTELGWLILYHAIAKDDPGKYKLGAMILNSKQPTEILYHSKGPILEPDEHYENEGFKSGVVYSCGAVVKDGKLLVYYGGADSVVCVASIKLLTLLNDLVKNKAVKLEKNELLKVE